VPTQTGYVLALFMDLVPEAFRQRVKDDFIARLEQDNTHLRTGFVGTPYLCRVLSNIGANDLAYKLLLNEDYPSWLYAINLDATTIWERLSICCAKKVFGRRAHRSKRWMIPENLSEFARPCQYPPDTGEAARQQRQAVLAAAYAQFRNVLCAGNRWLRQRRMRSGSTHPESAMMPRP
jgi:hypothetical protein